MDNRKGGLKLQINSREALEKFLVDDEEVYLYIKKHLIEELTKQQLGKVATEEIAKAVEKAQRQVTEVFCKEIQIQKPSIWRDPKEWTISPAMKEQLKARFTAILDELLAEQQNKVNEQYKKFEEYVNSEIQRIELKLKTHFETKCERVLSEKLDKFIQTKIDEGIKTKLAELTKILGNDPTLQESRRIEL